MGYEFGLFQPGQGHGQVEYVPPYQIKPSLTIVDLPVDVLFLISDHLETPEAFSLALTCRGLYSIGLPQTQRKLEADDQRELLTTLERDPMGKGHYFCHKCVSLHTYHKTYGPRSTDEKLDKSQAYVCGMRDRFAPNGNPFDLAYHHVRLVMNAHLYGPEYGIDLGNICVKHEARREHYTVQCSTSANIVEDELFLRRTYTLTLTGADVDAFRRCTGQRDFRLCEHMPFFRNSSIYHQAVPELQRRPRAATSKDPFVPCTNSPGSCGICLLDYDITIARMGRSGNTWRIKIDAYHQLGDCRSPHDWKWARFTERSRPHLFLPCRPNRRGTSYHPGHVKRAWTRAAVNGVVDGSVAQLKRRSL